jgi:hypothetical protein
MAMAAMLSWLGQKLLNPRSQTVEAFDASYLAFPKNKIPPAAGSKGAKSPQVTLVVSCDLGDPIVQARFRHAPEPAFVAVPEASVNKDNFS